MYLYRYFSFLLNFFILVPGLLLQAQEVRVEVGETDLKAGQPLEIKVFVPNSLERPEVVFPNLKGLGKGSTTRLRSSATAGDRTTPQEVIVQQYFTKETFLEIAPSEVLVDGRRLEVPGFVIRVSVREADSLAVGELAGADDLLPDNLEREDVFLTLRPNKQRLYLREGVGVYLSLFVAKDVTLSMEFYELDKQIAEISKQLKPDGCWEENTWIAEIVPRAISLRGRDYTEYRLYQSVFFPFIQKNVKFPAMALKMNMGAGGLNTKTFYAKPVEIEVLNLPPHPRRDQVAVGVYELEETLSTDQVLVGRPFKYRFGVKGEGNIAAIPAPTTIPVKTFEFYPPEVTQALKADLKAVTGTKVFNYTLVARQKGTFPLKGYFQWIFFDPVRAVYDTLRSERAIEVSGSTGATAESVEPIGENRLYANLEQLDSVLIHRNYSDIFRIAMNVIVILMLALALWMFRR